MVIYDQKSLISLKNLWLSASLAVILLAGHIVSIFSNKSSPSGDN